jgi:hypothetical protein
MTMLEAMRERERDLCAQMITLQARLEELRKWLSVAETPNPGGQGSQDQPAGGAVPPVLLLGRDPLTGVRG